jgi:RimJ/RimL family protein N-acetyltransferase
MKANYELCLSGENVILVPYRPEHVPTYHDWMTDPKLLELTSSEPLTLDEEVRMQEEWHRDEGKCTFVILARDLLLHDVDIGDDDCVTPPPPSEVKVEEEGDRRSYPSLIGRTLHAMIGDVNLFLSDVEEEDGDDGDEGGTSSDRDHRTSCATNSKIRQAEVDVMIAVPSHRRRNLGAEIAFAMMHYASSHLDVSRFFAKIHETNVPSLRLFECKLGYERCNYAACFGEHELECARKSPEEMTSWIEGRWKEWRRSTTARMMEGGTTTIVAPAAEEATVEVCGGGGGGGGGGRGGLHDRDDASGGTIDVVDGGVDGNENHRRVVRMYDACDCLL